jgi:hypothetical protein
VAKLATYYAWRDALITCFNTCFVIRRVTVQCWLELFGLHAKCDTASTFSARCYQQVALFFDFEGFTKNSNSTCARLKNY